MLPERITLPAKIFGRLSADFALYIYTLRCPQTFSLALKQVTYLEPQKQILYRDFLRRRMDGIDPWVDGVYVDQSGGAAAAQQEILSQHADGQVLCVCIFL